MKRGAERQIQREDGEEPQVVDDEGHSVAAGAGMSGDGVSAKGYCWGRDRLGWVN